MRMVVIGVVVAAAVALVAFDVVAAPYVFGPLVGLMIYLVGVATFASLRRGASHVPDGSEPQAIDLETERVTYWCEGCGTEVLLLVRGTPTPPRHCGERMAEHRDGVPTGLN